MYVVNLDGRCPVWRVSPRRHDGRGTAIFQEAPLLGLIDQRDLPRLRVPNHGRACYRQLIVAEGLPADQGGKLSKGSLHVVDSFPGMSPCSRPPTEGADIRKQWNVPKSREWNKGSFYSVGQVGNLSYTNPHRLRRYHSNPSRPTTVKKNAQVSQNVFFVS